MTDECERCLHMNPDDHVPAICWVNGVALCPDCVNELGYDAVDDRTPAA